MKRYFGWSLMLVLLTLGCEKYRLNQPAYLEYDFRFDKINSPVTIESGSFTLTELNVSGQRVKGEDVDITQSVPQLPVSFKNNSNLGIGMDIPIGEYKQFSTNLKLTTTNGVSLRVQGTTLRDGVPMPVIIEWFNPITLSFKPANGFELEKKEDYHVTLKINTDELFAGVSDNQWELASVTLENDVPTIVIRPNYNISIFNDINANIETALALEVK